MKKLSLLTVAISILFLMSFAYAAPSKVIPIQGKLTNPSGIPYNGQYTMTFKLFDSSAGETLLYTESISNVPVSAGLFSVVVGESSAINLPFDKDYYVEITIDSETLQPRQRLLSSPYSLYSQNSSYAVNSSQAQNANWATSAQTAVSAQNAVTATNVVGGNVDAVNGTFSGDYLYLGGGDSKMHQFSVYGGNGIATVTMIGNPANNGTAQIIVQSGPTGGFSISKDSYDAYLWNFGNQPILIGTNNSFKMIINNDGNVGIGTGTPTQLLDVNGNIKATGICIGSDCRTSWPSNFNLPQDVQFNSVNITTNLRVSGSASIAGSLIIGTSPPIVNNPIAFASPQGLLSTNTNYCYKITSTNPTGESVASNQVCVTTQSGQNTINLSWSSVDFASGYNVYGRTSNQEGLIATVSDTKFIDFGTTTPGAQPNPSATVGNIKATGGATFDGNVGIGTINPQTTLDVNGAVRFGSSGGLLYTNSPGNFGGKETVLTVNDGQGTNQDEIWIGPNTATGDKGYIQLRANKTYVQGNVGIGTTSPTSKLHIIGDETVQDGVLKFSLGQNNNIWWIRSNGAGSELVIGNTADTSDTNIKLRIGSDGKVRGVLKNCRVATGSASSYQTYGSGSKAICNSDEVLTGGACSVQGGAGGASSTIGTRTDGTPYYYECIGEYTPTYSVDPVTARGICCPA
ncbi:MAG: hypothetical protein HY831_03435 [Candidatus Aenigmarchaeota archaeon]|nr:hypothetical protein [Candidatus Aenigmarchaeota archaeon]